MVPGLLMDPERLLSSIPEPILKLGNRAQKFNYEQELIATKKQVNGVKFRSYSFFAPSTETLLVRLLACSRPGDIVYDAGANIGQYALPLSSKGCLVYAFEPDPTAFKQLVKNVNCNPNMDVRPFNLGVSNEDGTEHFYVSSRSTRSSFRQYNAESGGGEVTERKEVAVKTIDTLVAEDGLRPPDHIKVDVEGFGLEVLQGATNTIDKHRPTIYYEPHTVKRDGRTDKREGEMEEFFKSVGYEISRFNYPCWICTPTNELSLGEQVE